MSGSQSDRQRDVVPTKATIHFSAVRKVDKWVSAFAGTAIELGITIVLMCALLLAEAAAQMLAPNDNQPLQLQADSAIEWQQNAKLYIARGNAVAIRGPSEVHADTLI